MLRTYGGKLPPFAHLHVARLMKTCRELDIPWELSEDRTLEVCSEIMDEMDGEETRLLLTATRGLMPYTGASGKPHNSICGYPLSAIVGPQAWVYDGVTMQSIVCRPFYPQWKHQSRLQMRVVERSIGNERVWPLLIDSYGRPMEATGANIFFVQQAQVIQIPQENCLPGVTAQIVAGLARNLGYSVNGAVESLDHLLETTVEAFCTCSPLGIVPIRSIDDRPVGACWPGVATALLQEVFARLVGIDVAEQARGWAK